VVGWLLVVLCDNSKSVHIVCDNFESGVGLWTTGNDPTTSGGDTSISSTWALATQTLGTTPVTLGTTWYGNGNNGRNFGAERSWIEFVDTLTVPNGCSNVEVHFDSYSSNEGDLEFDVEHVQMSVNGAAFADIHGYDVRLHQHHDQRFHFVSFAAAVTPGDSLRVRFLYDTGDDGFGPIDIIGWFVDDFGVSCTGVGPMCNAIGME
jgi:hypothetical protein